MQDLKTIFGQQISLKWDHCPLKIKILNIYYVTKMFSPNMHWLNLWKIKSKAVLNAFIEIVNQSKTAVSWKSGHCYFLCNFFWCAMQ